MARDMETPAAARDALNRFANARLGLFVHFGLFSVLGRGEWALNREAIAPNDYRSLAERFDPKAFDAEALADMAARAGCRYVCFTTMHHEGFALYDSEVNPFNSVKASPCGRDLVNELVQACRSRGLGVHLYHSLNQWLTPPGVPHAAEAMESDAAQEAFVGYTHERLRELVTRFNPIDCLWYDGTWPFDAEGWRAVPMNEMLRSIQPHLMFNGRNGLPGDFATPEQHLSAPASVVAAGAPWEACVTHNRNWGYHAGDRHFKSTADVIDMLIEVAAGAGNLLLNVGPDGDGRLPVPTATMLEEVGDWLNRHGEAIYASDPFSGGEPGQGDGAGRGDWCHHGRMTVKDRTLYLHLFNWPGRTFSIAGLDARVRSCRLLAADDHVQFTQTPIGSRSRVTFDNLPNQPPHEIGGVLAIECDRPPTMYLTGGLRQPSVAHPRYDPVAVH